MAANTVLHSVAVVSMMIGTVASVLRIALTKSNPFMFGML